MSRSPRADKPSAPASPVPRGGVIAIVSILGAMVLLALYSNAQKWRREKIETVTITRAAATLSPPSASPTPP